MELPVIRDARTLIMNQSVFVGVAVWRLIDDKPLPEAMMTWVRRVMYASPSRGEISQWGVSIYGCRLTSIKIPIKKIRRCHDLLIFVMGIPYMERPSLYSDGALAIKVDSDSYIIWLHHKIEIRSALLSLCQGNPSGCAGSFFIKDMQCPKAHVSPL